jgi:hypothetical protein
MSEMLFVFLNIVIIVIFGSLIWFLTFFLLDIKKPASALYNLWKPYPGRLRVLKVFFFISILAFSLAIIYKVWEIVLVLMKIWMQ